MLGVSSVFALHAWKLYELWCKNGGEPNAVFFKIVSFLRSSLHLAIAKSGSVRYTRDSRLNGSRYINALYSIRQSDLSSFLTPNFIFSSLGFAPNDCVKER